MVSATRDPDEPDGRDIPRIPEPDTPGEKRAQGRLYDELVATVERCRMEYDLTPFDVCGVLSHVMFAVEKNAWDEAEEDDS